jgi:WD40 repeat protein
MMVRFSFAGGEPIQATVAPKGWRTEQQGDLALLVLDRDPPPLAQPAQLRPTRDVTGHACTAYGYPEKHYPGVWSELVVAGQTVDRIQLTARTSYGRQIEKGFSGTGLFDTETGAVVGLVVTRDESRGVLGGFAIPLQAAVEAFPELGGWVGWRLGTDRYLHQHWRPRARGVYQDTTPGWYFTGRTALLRELTGWLEHDSAGRAMRVVTGPAGTGKSAVLAWLCALSDPQLRAEIAADFPSALADAAAVPAEGRISAAVWARDLDADSVAGVLASALALPVATGAAVHEVLDAIGRLDLTERARLVVVLDALDEARLPRQIAREVLLPMARDLGVKVLAGTRSGQRDILLEAFGAGAVVYRLDAPAWFTRRDLADYAAACLRADYDPASRSGYRADPDACELVAEAIADSAGSNFLVAGLAARERAHEPVIDVATAGWRDRQPFPAEVGQAFEDYLSRFGENQTRARDLLRAVAYAEGTGLPADGHGQPSLWAAIASRLSTRDYTRSDVADVLEDGDAYLVETVDDETGRTNYRLFHQALVDHLRPANREKDSHQGITKLLLSRVPRQADGGRDWKQADDYALRHLAAHASIAGQLDQLLDDPGFLIFADPAGLIGRLPREILSMAPSSRSARAARLYRRRAALLHGATPERRAGIFEIAAAQVGDDDLRMSFANIGLDRHWRFAWAHWLQEADSLLLGQRRPGVEAVAAVVMPNGVPLSVTATAEDSEQPGRWVLRCWDLVEGVESIEPLSVDPGVSATLTALLLPDQHPHVLYADRRGSLHDWDLVVDTTYDQPQSPVRALAAVQAPSAAPLIACGGDDGTLRCWNPVARAFAGEPIQACAVSVVALAGVAGSPEPLAVFLGEDGTIGCWDITTGTRWGHSMLLERHVERPIGLTATLSSDGNPTAVIALENGSVHLLDFKTGRRAVLLEAGQQVRALAGLRVAEKSLVAITGLDNYTRCWDLATKTQVGLPMAESSGGVRALCAVALGNTALVITCDWEGMTRCWEVDPSMAAPDPGIGPVANLAVAAPNGHDPLLVTGGWWDRALRIWSLNSGVECGSLLAGPETKAVTSVCTLSRPSAPPLTVGGGNDGRLYLWNAVDGEQFGNPLSTGSGARGLAAVVSPAGSPLVVALGQSGSDLQCWDINEGIQRWATRLPRAATTVAAATPNNGPGIVVTGDWDGVVRCWDLRDGSQFGEPARVHARNIQAIAIASLPDGSTIAVTGSDDGGVWCWDLAVPPTNGRFLGKHRGAVQAVAVVETSNNSIFAASGSIYGSVRFWPLRGSTAPPDSLQIAAQINSLAAHSAMLIIGAAPGVIAVEVAPSQREPPRRS